MVACFLDFFHVVNHLLQVNALDILVCFCYHYIDRKVYCDFAKEGRAKIISNKRIKAKS